MAGVMKEIRRAKKAEAPPPLVVRPDAPAMLLVRTQLAENIGTTARAMYNCAITDLRLVDTRDPPTHEKARAAATTAANVLEAARTFPTIEAASADLTYLFATTARRRELVKPILTPREAAREIHAITRAGGKVGILFGPERTGLENDEVAMADAIIEVPLNPAHRSLNIAQAVLLVSYEWFLAAEEPIPRDLPGGVTASKEELFNFFAHLEKELDDCGFLRNAEKRPGMVRNLRALFQRAGLTSQEVRTLHGVVTELRWGRRPERQNLNRQSPKIPGEKGEG